MELTLSSSDHDFNSTKSNIKTATTQEINPIDKTMKSLISCEENMCERIKANIVYQCLKEVSLNQKGILSENTTSKLKALLLIHELDKYMHLPLQLKHTQEKLTLLGIYDLPLCDLSLDEKLEVKYCVEAMLRERIHDMLLRYEVLQGNIKKVLKSNEYNMHNKFLECHDTRLLQRINRIEELVLEYQSALSKYTNLMTIWNKLKYEDMSEAYVKKSEHLLLQAQLAEQQAKVTKLSCIIKMFQETPITVDAFKKLNQIVEEKLKAVMDEIRQKEDLKKQYNLKNTEYDQVLKNYTELYKAIKKKKQVLNMLK